MMSRKGETTDDNHHAGYAGSIGHAVRTARTMKILLEQSPYLYRQTSECPSKLLSSPARGRYAHDVVIVVCQSC